MKKFFLLSLVALVSCFAIASTPKTIKENVKDSIVLNEVSVTSLYRNNVNVGSLIGTKTLIEKNYGEEPSFVFAKMPSIFAYNDNGTNFGYSYFRLRGMGQERLNVTLDGMPWNESEDFGCYFSNSPDLMASMHSIKVERGASVTTNGTSAYGGNVSLESVNLRTDTTSYFDIGYGNFNTYRVTGVYNMGVRNHWGLHIRGTHQATDGYKTHGYNRSQALTVKLGYFFNDNHSIDLLSMNGLHRNGQSFYGVTEDMLETPKPFGQIENANLPQETDNFLMLINKLTYNGKFSNNWFFTASAYWNFMKGDYRIMYGNMNNYDLVHHLVGGNAVARYVKDNLNLTFGTNASYFTRKHVGTPFANDSIVDMWSHKSYMKDDYINRGNKPDINVFVRTKYSWKKFDFNGDLTYRHTSLSYNPTLPMSDDDTHVYSNWNFVNGGVGVTYNIDNRSKAYIRWASTGKEPSRVDLLGGEYNDGHLWVNPKAKERVNDFEIGYEITTRRLNANINLFNMYFNNELVASGALSDQNGLPLHEQKDGHRYGIEASVDYNPFRSFHIVENVGWSRNRIEGGNTHTFSPSLTNYTEVNYTFGKTKVGTSLNYRSRMYIDLENKFNLRPMVSWNAFVSTKINDNFEISGNFVNITNRLNTSSGYIEEDGRPRYLIDTPFSFFVNTKFTF